MEIYSINFLDTDECNLLNAERGCIPSNDPEDCFIPGWYVKERAQDPGDWSGPFYSYQEAETYYQETIVHTQTYYRETVVL